jgi:hypothetical protein
MFTPKMIFSCLILVLSVNTLSAEEIRGVITKADATRKTFTVEERGKGRRNQVLTLSVDSDTDIRRGKEAVKIEDLVVGKRVRVLYEQRKDDRLAIRVTMPASLTNPGQATVLGDPSAFAGLLRRVAYTEPEVVVIGLDKTEKETVVLVPEEVKVTRLGKPIAYDDVQEGETAIVKTEKKERRLYAKEISIGTAESAQSTRRPEQPIEKVRQILKFLDAALQQLEEKQK